MDSARGTIALGQGNQLTKLVSSHARLAAVVTLATAPPVVIDEARIELAARELTEVERHVGWERVTKVCEVIARHFLNGDVERIHSHPVPIRRLAAHPLCPLSKTRLDEILAAHRVYRDEPDVARSQLSPSHVAVVARCPLDERRSLLQLAATDSLGVRELKQRLRDARQGRGERRGRPPSQCAEKAYTRLENAELLVEEAVDLLGKAESLGDLDGRIEASIKRLFELLELGVTRLDSLAEPCPHVRAKPLTSEIRQNLNRPSLARSV